MKKHFPLLLTALFSLLPLLASATSIFDLLYQGGDDAARKVTLTVAMDSILAKSPLDQTATFQFTDAQGQVQNWDLKVSIRGKFRRNRCEFAPLKFNFSKKDLKAAGLTNFDKYKLVTPCTDDAQAEGLITKEYLAYRAYNLLSPYSFRVQLLEITYVDANGRHPKRTETAFLIEDIDELAARHNAEEVENALGLPAEAYDPTAEATHALFQYLVGNGDWSLPLSRNLKVLRLPNGKLAPVGYDFDFTGWVGAPYASPTLEVGQTSIYERVYLGYLQDDLLMREVATSFREQRKEVLSLINRARLDEVEKEVLWRFASRFFNTINRMNNDGSVLLYDQLRGTTAGIIPPGAAADSYQSLGK
ncbi:hypothetical protein QWY85_02375 [Neolewinella lacunae]|uniref:Uncharacterized protein n=1 Tax=Neolewinella lacunae TaxID=1517758 RepID=A0A923T850_9BACT|nr:hypothetical protein [Neolewinella lacunae]MBC6993583.1 hypothetical protein [Neolewinella lacunae]MDN3633485.1 hypothetical protein [Neolewinella lacunae]